MSSLAAFAGVAAAGAASFLPSAIVLFRDVSRRKKLLAARIAAVGCGRRDRPEPAAGGRPNLHPQRDRGVALLLGRGSCQPDDGRLCIFGLAAGLCEALAGTYVLGPVAIPAGVLPMIVLPRILLRRRRRKRDAALLHQLPDALAAIVRGVRVGVPVSATLAVVAEEAAEPTASAFRQACEELALGQPLAISLQAMAERTGSLEYRFFANALTLQARTGGALADTLDLFADTIRRRIAIRARGHALASEARMTCYVLAALPMILLLAMSLLNPRYIAVFFVPGPGRTLLLLSAGLLTAGILAMRQLTRSALG